jgi:hypothetical protein
MNGARGRLIKLIPLQIGDILRLRKPHPCGSSDWKVMRTGMDFRIQCLGCQHQAWIPRVKLERQIKEILTKAETKGGLIKE